jgi:hypothetical protein
MAEVAMTPALISSTAILRNGRLVFIFTSSQSFRH